MVGAVRAFLTDRDGLHPDLDLLRHADERATIDPDLGRAGRRGPRLDLGRRPHDLPDLVRRHSLDQGLLRMILRSDRRRTGPCGGGRRGHVSTAREQGDEGEGSESKTTMAHDQDRTPDGGDFLQKNGPRLPPATREAMQNAPGGGARAAISQTSCLACLGGVSDAAPLA